ncbi:MAG: hypothetical protein ACPGO3_03780 [Magnetospiraceae bacterium]
MAFGRTRRRVDMDPFTDLLFNVLLSLSFLFIMVLLFMQPPAKTGVIDAKADYIVTVTWPDESPDDIDTWVQGPNGDLLWFKVPEIGLMHLDRDDRGRAGDQILVNGELIENPLNQEVVTLRGVAEGEYVVNLHYYESRSQRAVEAKVRVVKVNPAAEVVFYGGVTLSAVGEERTAVRFSIAKDGTVRDVSTLEKSIVRLRGG